MSIQAAESEVTDSRVLLLVDSNPLIRSACRRYLEAGFEQLFECDSLLSVGPILSSAPITDLICAAFFPVAEEAGRQVNGKSLRQSPHALLGRGADGTGWNIGRVVAGWRALQPSLRHIVLLSAQLELPSAVGVDLILSLPFEPRALGEFLFSDARRPAAVEADVCRAVDSIHRPAGSSIAMAMRGRLPVGPAVGVNTGGRT